MCFIAHRFLALPHQYLSRATRRTLDQKLYLGAHHPFQPFSCRDIRIGNESHRHLKTFCWEQVELSHSHQHVVKNDARIACTDDILDVPKHVSRTKYFQSHLKDSEESLYVFSHRCLLLCKLTWKTIVRLVYLFRKFGPLRMCGVGEEVGDVTQDHGGHDSVRSFEA